MPCLRVPCHRRCRCCGACPSCSGKVPGAAGRSSSTAGSSIIKPISKPLCGIAVDLGTTTIVAKLIDLETGRVLATVSELNRQRRHGEDVISRISHANAHGVEPLRQLIIGQLNGMIDQLLEQANHHGEDLPGTGRTSESGGNLQIDRAADKDGPELPVRGEIGSADIYEMVLAGNTVMQHLFLGLPPRHLAEMPYVPVMRALRPQYARELGLALHPEAEVHLLPGLGKFVGGDTAAVLLTLADRLDGTWLAVDIGTNGEILLCHQGRIWTTSAAAGPAFEGAHIAAGMRAAAGAIERVYWKRDHLEVQTIGGGEATGICGSGLIDAVAALLEAGALDETGRLLEDHALVTSEPPAGLPQSQPAARLTDKVWLAQKDIREVQLAKGAIATAIALLLRNANLQPSDLRHIYLAGAFGQYIRPEAALKIGLLPRVDPARIKFIGNAACAGAEIMLINGDERHQIEELARKVEYIEVAADKDFQNLFADNLLFASRE